MDNNSMEEQSYNNSNSFMQIILRFITSAIILGITAFFTPGFTINNIWALALAAIILSLIDYMLIKFTNIHSNSIGKGFTGFILSAIILYVTQYFVAGYSISWLSALMGALIYGVVDFFIPET